MDLKKEQIDFTYLYKIIKINQDEITFRKFKTDITKSLTNSNDYSTVSLTKEEGDEIYKVSPEVNELLIGKVGEVIKGIKGKVYGKKKKSFIVNEIVEIENTILN